MPVSYEDFQQQIPSASQNKILLQRLPATHAQWINSIPQASETDTSQTDASPSEARHTMYGRLEKSVLFEPKWPCTGVSVEHSCTICIIMKYINQW